MQRFDVAILGGGMAGLTSLATELVRSSLVTKHRLYDEAENRSAMRKQLSPIVRDMERCLPKVENEDGPSLRQLIQLAVRPAPGAKGEPAASM